MVLLQEIARDKEFKLRQGLNVVGVTHTTYWINWTIVGTLLNIKQTLVLMCCGRIFQFELWKNCDNSILFYLFFIYGQCFVFFAFFVSTLITSLDMANQLSYSIILANVLVETSFTNTALTLKLFYSDAVIVHQYINVVVWFLECFPTFSFSMAFGQICMIASKKFDFNTINWVEGKHLGYDDYHNGILIISKTTFDVIHTKSIEHFVNCILQSGIFFFVMFWYCDHIFSSNRGVAYSLYFPLQKSYWMTVFPFFSK